MEQHDLMDAHVQARRMYNLLNEVMDASRQLAEAVDRDDKVSVSMLLGMRQTPINQVKEVDAVLQRLGPGHPDPATGKRLEELVHGSAAMTPEEQPLADQIASNMRLLRQVLELDKSISRKLARDKSVYGSN